MNFKQLTLSTLFLCLMVQLPLLAVNGPFVLRQDYEKTYSESFNVDGDGSVRLENRYGEIRVETWDRDEVKIDVRVRVSAKDQDDADKTFDRIRIDFSSSGNTASATTTIGNGKRGKGWFEKIIDGDWWGNGNSNDYKIYYVVKMPASADLTTSAKYCDVELPDLSGDTDLSVGYGDLYAGDLTGERNSLSVSYGSARVGALAGRSEIRMRYSEGTLTEGGDLRYDGRYSEFRMGDVGNLNLNIGYEDLEVESAKEVRMDGNYNDVEIDRVETLIIDGNYNDWEVNLVENELEVDASYGDLAIDRLAAGFTRVYIRTNYIDVELDVDSDAGYEMELRSRYGDISYDRGRAQNVNSDKSGSSHSVTATMPGKGSGKIDISTSYGDIELD